MFFNQVDTFNNDLAGRQDILNFTAFTLSLPGNTITSSSRRIFAAMIRSLEYFWCQRDNFHELLTTKLTSCLLYTSTDDTITLNDFAVTA